MNRRDVMKLMAAAPFAAAAACSRTEPSVSNPSKPSGGDAMPVLFLAHGAPMLLDDPGWVAELSAWAKALPTPKAILMVSAHWEEAPVTLGATTPVPLVYDFSGFPRRFYELQYPSPGAPALAARVKALLSEKGIPFREDPTRGQDHGSYIPLMCMYPRADIPVLQLSMPSMNTRELYRQGEALAQLRNEGVLVVGSGFITHNMRLGFSKGTPAWAKEFDLWAKDVVARHDVDALLDFHAKAPAAKLALPTDEHFAPLLVSAGALGGQKTAVKFPIEGFWMDAGFTRRSVQFG